MVFTLLKKFDERRSPSNRGPSDNRWLYPDLVAMEDLSVSWHQEVKDCVREYADKRTKLWSSEVKLLINSSNVRECFFKRFRIPLVASKLFYLVLMILLEIQGFVETVLEAYYTAL